MVSKRKFQPLCWFPVTSSNWKKESMSLPMSGLLNPISVRLTNRPSQENQTASRKRHQHSPLRHCLLTGTTWPTWERALPLEGRLELLSTSAWKLNLGELPATLLVLNRRRHLSNINLNPLESSLVPLHWSSQFCWSLLN